VNGQKALKSRGCSWFVGGNSASILHLTFRFPTKFASRVHCNIAFGELVVKFPESRIKGAIDTLILALTDILQDVPLIDFDECLSWQGMSHDTACACDHYLISDPLDWALPDQLVFSTVSALLHLSSSHPQYAEQATSAICAFIAETVKKIETSRRKWCQGSNMIY
jgi:phosphatidylinositol 4-kinase